MSSEQPPGRGSVAKAFGLRGFVGLALVIGVAWWLIFGRSSTPSVDWSNYSPTVRARIDVAVAAKDCPALQTEFNNAHAADLLTYLDTQMRGLGCYG